MNSGHLSQEDADLHHILVFLCQGAIMDIITWLIRLLLLYILGKTWLCHKFVPHYTAIGEVSRMLQSFIILYIFKYHPNSSRGTPDKM
jgi:hypothetical protein